MSRTLEIQGTPPEDEAPKPSEVPVSGGQTSYSPAREAHAAQPQDSDWGWDFQCARMTRGQRISLAVTAPAGWSIDQVSASLDGHFHPLALPPSEQCASMRLMYTLDAFSPGSTHRLSAVALAKKDGQGFTSRSWVEEWQD